MIEEKGEMNKNDEWSLTAFLKKWDEDVWKDYCYALKTPLFLLSVKLLS